MTAAIENQIERFAPGFKELIIVPHLQEEVCTVCGLPRSGNSIQGFVLKTLANIRHGKKHPTK